MNFKHKYNTQFGNNYDDLMASSLYAIKHYGNMIPSRAGATQELIFNRQVLIDPGQCFPTLESRKHNIFALLAEITWVLYGDNNTRWLSYWLPRANDFSDDGETWRAGYGPRLTNFTGVNDAGEVTYVDQIQSIYEELHRNPGTRQAVINIYDAVKDTPMFGKTKDIACNNRLHFLIRDDCLNLEVNIRSNDMVWGNAINVAEWSYLLSIMAASLGVDRGELTITQGSLHVYSHHFDRMDAILSEAYPMKDRNFRSIQFSKVPFADQRSVISRLHWAGTTLINGDYEASYNAFKVAMAIAPETAAALAGFLLHTDNMDMVTSVYEDISPYIEGTSLDYNIKNALKKKASKV